MSASPQARGEEIEYGATLRPDTAWAHEVKTAQGRTVPMSETLWMRSREVVRATLVPKIAGKWARPGPLGPVPTPPRWL